MELRALRISILATAVLGLLGVAWGLVSGSQVILLDGVYGVIGIGTSWLLLRASTLAEQGPTRAYPFGREAVTPMAIGIQGIVQLATLLYAAFEAVWVILRGGSAVAPGPAILYSAIATASSVAVWLWLRRHAAGSELLASEAIAWRLAAVRGLAMLGGFVVLLLVTDTSLAWIGPYIDPVMVLLTCVLLVSAPLVLVRRTIGELLEIQPPAGVTEPVLAAVAAVEREFDLDPPIVRVTKVGPKLYVEVEGVASPTVTIDQEHRVRTALARRLDALPYEIWLTLELVPRPSAGSAG